MGSWRRTCKRHAVLLRSPNHSHNAKVIIPDYQPFIRPINLNMLMLSLLLVQSSVCMCVL